MRPFWTALVALLLTCSGACALIYQVAWFREFQLVFGSTTASTAAVVAIFMGGLGIGNAVLGKRADRRPNPLGFYARLEFCIAAIAALTPLLIDAIRWAYIGLGGQMTLGIFGATLVRLLFSALVILLPTILMGGTLPAAAAAVTIPEDQNRRAAGLLYGCNTLGAVAGTLASTFFLLAWIGTRSTLWSACVLNFTVAALAGLLARSYQKEGLEEGVRGEGQGASVAYPPSPIPHPSPLAPHTSGYVYAAALIVGFGFMLMELVWYRMLASILGGTTYTFGLILAIALLGIGIGGATYPLIFHRRFSPSLSALSLTCGLEAALIALPFALGDDLAYDAAILHVRNQLGFLGEIIGWVEITSLVVLPASIISGVQFPLLLGLLGRAKRDIGKQLGYTYVANTCGGILGSLAGGFGLLPLLTAPGAWRLVVFLLTALSLGIALVEIAGKRKLGSRAGWQPTPPRGWLILVRTLALPLGVGMMALALVSATGPTAFWRHSGIGAGRAEIPRNLTPNMIQAWKNDVRRGVIWQADGVEAGVAIQFTNGLAFYINGKSDGNAILDATTQITLGVLPALLHDEPKTCLVVGLGTGETAGWLAEVPSVKQIDVVEIEPTVTEIARRCALVNGNVLTNPKVRLIFNDAREVLLTTHALYDVISSEPSNPYRAGIANLFTREFYLSVDARLKQGGLFVQWLQGYEIDQLTVSTVLATLKSVFGYVEIWQSGGSDMLLVCSQKPLRYDLPRLRERMRQEPYRSAFAAAWRADRVEGLIARYVGGNALSEALAAECRRLLNTDDLNRLEYGFARTLGRRTGFSPRLLCEKAASLSADRPDLRPGQIDWDGVELERMAMYALTERIVPAIPPNAPTAQAEFRNALQLYLKKDYPAMVAQWASQHRQAVYPTETAMLALAYAELGNEKAIELLDRLRAFNAAEAELIRGILLCHLGLNHEAADVLSQAFVTLRSNPWPMIDVTDRALTAAEIISSKSYDQAHKLLPALKQPFAALYMEHVRRRIGCLISSYIGPKNMIPWIESFEPNVPWIEVFLQLRVQAYSATGHPLEAKAERDLKLFQEQEARTDLKATQEGQIRSSMERPD